MTLPARCVAALALACAGCATVPPSPPAAPASAAAERFEARGRFSAKHGTEAVAGGFAWSHDRDRDAIVFTAPTGQAVARLEGDAGGVRLDLPDGGVRTAPDWETLTGRALGVPIPVRGLAAWVQGVPRPGSPHDAARDAAGRLEVLRQDGWQIAYAWRESAQPARLVLTYPDVEVRLAIDDWRE